MDIAGVAIEGYRSIRSISFPLDRLTVLVGANGAGKTNLYSALGLMQAAATGTLSEQIQTEGGLGSVFWAGERRSHEKTRISFSVTLDAIEDEKTRGTFAPTYVCEIGFPRIDSAAFELEAEVKQESLVVRTGGRKLAFMERKGHVLWARDEQGARVTLDEDLLPSETALSRMSLWASHPEIAAVRDVLTRWRFFHAFRTDPGSALRHPCPAVTSPILSSDGGNLAAVFATLRHIRADTAELDAAIDDAFPGAALEVPPPEQSASFALRYPDFPNREFAAHELSDGTLQYLALMGALMSYRLPPFLALNEPETSLHPSLLAPLGRLIAQAAQRTQILVVTHSEALATAIAAHSGISTRQVIKSEGATWIEGLSRIGTFVEE